MYVFQIICERTKIVKLANMAVNLLSVIIFISMFGLFSSEEANFPKTFKLNSGFDIPYIGCE
jgi:hypothetical protein